MIERQNTNKSELGLKTKHTEWGGTAINAKARRLNNWITNSPNFDIIPILKSTIIGPTTSSYIDFFIVSTSISTVR
uniref:Uncharacterized protein n=1 Tax=Glossina palpalis gambiensis TaxID=67801 RepID=A0A1B0B441_9MUSC